MDRRTSLFTRVLRLARLALHLVHGVLTVALVFPTAGKACRARQIQRWSARLLDILAVHLEVSGTAPGVDGGPVVIIANHISWLDIYAINTLCTTRFVAKSEIRRWPVIGWLSKHIGTLYIERARRHHVAAVNREIAAALMQLDNVAIFPEGTTGPGDSVLPFHASLLQPVIHYDAKLHPLAIRYLHADSSRCGEAAYYGDISLLASLLLVVTQPTIRVKLHFLPSLACDNRNRRDLARRTALAIADVLKVPALSGHYRSVAAKRSATDASPIAIAPPAYRMSYRNRRLD